MLVFSRLQKFLDKYKIINDYQHGFREGWSTTTAAYHYVDKIYENIDKHENTLCVFIDLSRAFDLVDHKILLHILHHIGIRGLSHDWFK
jgi:hypothetical protein